jgi:hypothetical protein
MDQTPAMGGHKSAFIPWHKLRPGTEKSERVFFEIELRIGFKSRLQAQNSLGTGPGTSCWTTEATSLLIATVAEGYDGELALI